MMRSTFTALATLVAGLWVSTSAAQQATQNPGGAVQTGNAVVPAGNAAQNPAGVQPVNAEAAVAPRQPFAPLDPQAQARLNQILMNWQQVSQATVTLECSFDRWHFDMFAAPAGVHAHKAKGIVRYASPDKGLFRVDEMMFFKGMQQGKPQYGAVEGKFGEHWVCNGRELIEFDRTEKKCTVLALPPEMRGKEIFNSPLPFVFNLDAQKIHQRYWVREVKAPKEGIYLIEAWPKRKEDAAQYRFVQVALNGKTFLPDALIMYAPNFDPKKAPQWDHYEFNEMKRNGVGARLLKRFHEQWFIPEQPGKGWEIVRENFVQASTENAPAARQAAAPGVPAGR